jgi:hypothetical protein
MIPQLDPSWKLLHRVRHHGEHWTHQGMSKPERSRCELVKNIRTTILIVTLVRRKIQLEQGHDFRTQNPRQEFAVKESSSKKPVSLFHVLLNSLVRDVLVYSRHNLACLLEDPLVVPVPVDGTELVRETIVLPQKQRVHARESGLFIAAIVA